MVSAKPAEPWLGWATESLINDHLVASGGSLLRASGGPHPFGLRADRCRSGPRRALAGTQDCFGWRFLRAQTAAERVGCWPIRLRLLRCVAYWCGQFLATTNVLPRVSASRVRERVRWRLCSDLIRGSG
jgi:hypothetical protein